MILRQSILQRGCKALRPPATRSVSWARHPNNVPNVDTVASSLAHSEQQVHSIEAQINTIPSGYEHVLPQDIDEPGVVVSRYQLFRRHKRLIHPLGTTVLPHYQPHTLITNPPSPKDVTLELLLASQAHLGHATSLWNPANQRYIFGIRQGIHIISLDIIAAHLRRAAKIVSGVCERGGLVLFVGTRPGQDRCVVRAASLAGACHLFDRWIPGSLTNGQQILASCRLKVVDELDRELSGFEERLHDIPVLKPDLVVCLNPLENYVLLHECGLNNIPTIGIIDTDADPTWVTYPIPANDDSLRCVQVIAGVLGRAGEEGQQKRRAAAERGEIPYAPNRNLQEPKPDRRKN